MHGITEVLNGIEQGKLHKAEELRRLAAVKYAREAPGQTLQATALVHEVWLKLTRYPNPTSETPGDNETKWRTIVSLLRP